MLQTSEFNKNKNKKQQYKKSNKLHCKGAAWPIKNLSIKTWNSSRNKRKIDRQWHMQIRVLHQTTTKNYENTTEIPKPVSTKKETTLIISVLV